MVKIQADCTSCNTLTFLFNAHRTHCITYEFSSHNFYLSFHLLRHQFWKSQSLRQPAIIVCFKEITRVKRKQSRLQPLVIGGWRDHKWWQSQLSHWHDLKCMQPAGCGRKNRHWGFMKQQHYMGKWLHVSCKIIYVILIYACLNYISLQ